MKSGHKKASQSVSKSGWMPFWWKSKHNKRLSQKRNRKFEEQNLKTNIDANS